MIDMSDLEVLDDVTLDLPEDEPEIEDVAPAPPETPGRETLSARTPSETPEVMPALAADDLLEEAPPAPPATSARQPEADVEIELEELDLDEEKNA